MKQHWIVWLNPHPKINWVVQGIREKVSAADRSRKKAFHMNSETGWLKIQSLAIAWPAFNPDSALISYVQATWPIYFFISYWVTVALQCCVSFCCWIKWSAILIPISSPSYTYPHDPTPLGHHRALSWAPCAAQQPPISYLPDTW